MNDKFINEILELVKNTKLLKDYSDNIVIEVPPDENMGDYAMPCFPFAKMLKKSPMKIAELIQDELNLTLPQNKNIKKVEVKSGYINFFIKKEALITYVMENAIQEKENFGKYDIGKNRVVVLDFSSPNIAKPFGIGHLRSTIIGRALYKIYQNLGFKPIGINHLGDWGTQFGNLICAYLKWGNDNVELSVDYLVKLYIKFHEEAKSNNNLIEEGRQWFSKLEKGDKTANELWNKFKNISLNEFQMVYELLDVKFDEYVGESYYIDRAENVIELVKQKGLLELSEGAEIVNMERFNLSPCILRKSDGATKYETRDLAALLFRKEKYNFDKILYVVGSDQKEHFEKLFTLVNLLGFSWSANCHHVAFGLIRFKGDKMSTRKGHTILLMDVINKAIEITKDILQERDLPEEEKEFIAKAVGIGAVIFNDLKSKRIKDVDFDWDKVLAYDNETKSFKGETGPYVQYTNMRLNSVIKKYEKPINYNANLLLLKEDDEFALCKYVLKFKEVMLRGADENEPSYIANYLIKLCNKINSYWHNHKILNENESLAEARILLCVALKNALQTGMDIVGLNVLEKM